MKTTFCLSLPECLNSYWSSPLHRAAAYDNRPCTFNPSLIRSLNTLPSRQASRSPSISTSDSILFQLQYVNLFSGLYFFFRWHYFGFDKFRKYCPILYLWNSFGLSDITWVRLFVIVADVEAGLCLGPEGSEVSLGEGGEGGPGPPGGGKDKQSVLSEGRDNMGKDEEDRASRTWWRRNGANRVSGFFLNKIEGILQSWLLNWFWYHVSVSGE